MIVDINDPRIVQWIKGGKVFIYPTDTIYGIGCDATNEASVQRIRKIKETQKPWSVIAPGKDWIKNNCNSGTELEKLPGSYTFIYKSDVKVACNNDSGTIGVRIPNHIFSTYIEEARVPFVTTSVNKTGQTHIHSITQIRPDMFAQVDIIVDVGPIEGTPSTIIDYTGSEPKIIRKA